MAKITLTHVKSFVKKHRAELQIKKLSQFDGMIDCVSSIPNAAFHLASAPDTTGKAFKSLGRDPYMGIAGAWFVYGSRDHFSAFNEEGMVGIEVSNCCGRFVLAVTPAQLSSEWRKVLAPAPSPLLDELTSKIAEEVTHPAKQPRIVREQIPLPAAPPAPEFKVAIVDAEKAGLINGPFWVVVLKDGKVVSSTTGIQGPTGANGVARNYGFAYGVPAASVPQVAA